MVLGRLAFGFKGNAVPAVLMSVTAGVGWFATNSVSGAYALATLFGIAPLLGLVIIVLLQTGARLLRAQPGAGVRALDLPGARGDLRDRVGGRSCPSRTSERPPAPVGVGGMGGFLLTVGTAFGYAAGWTPYAADYTRYLPATVSTARTGFFAAAGLFLSCVVLEVVGAASVTIGGDSLDNPTAAFTSRARLAAGQGDTAGHRDRCHRGQLHQHLFGRNGFRDIGHQTAAPHRQGTGHRVLRRGGVPGGLVGAARRGAQLRGVPVDHRLLDRPVAGGDVRRPIPAARPDRRAFPLRPLLCELERAAVVRHRTGGVGAVVLEPGEVRRLASAKACPAARRRHVLRRVPAVGRGILVLCRSKIAAERVAV